MEKFLITSNSKPSASRQKEDDNDCDSSKVLEEPPPKKQKKQKYRDFNEKWLIDITFKNWLSKKEQECGLVTAFCNVCNCAVINHKPALVKHMKAMKHIQNMNSISNTTSIEQKLKPKKEDELKNRAELKICSFLAQHNLPLSLSDDLITFLANTFSDSEVIKSINFGRTKATYTIKNVIGPILTQELVEKLKKHHLAS